MQVVDGRATLVDAHTVKVDDNTYTAERILIATGGWPFVPEVEGSEHIVTSNEIFNLPTLPKQMVIVGGGYIAVEFAGIMHGLGVDVTIFERGAKSIARL